MSDETLDVLSERIEERMSNEENSGDEALEVIFESGAPHRRRSSLINTNFNRPGIKRDPASCYVHRLLEQTGQAVTQQSREGMESENPADKPSGPPGNTGHHARSRLMTKKQLSDMAFGIRELSKRLSQLKMMLNVRNIFMLVKAYDDSLKPKAVEMSKWLLEQKMGYTVWIEEGKWQDHYLAEIIGDGEGAESRRNRLKFWTRAICTERPSLFDIVISLGGDGTVLYASYLFQRVVPPVISFALGSLGFLTKFDYAHFPQILPQVFKDGVTLSLRLRFEGTVMRSIRREGATDEEHKKRDLTDELVGSEMDNNRTHRPDHHLNILNEIVLDRGPSANMSSMELFGDEEWFTTVQADGICISTPTGSTAYNLAAGGSLSHPDNPVMLVTAIAPHTLNFRPIILPDTMVLRVGVPYDARTGSWASFDGKDRTELFPGDYVTVSAARFPYPTIMPLDKRSEDWMDSICRTLQWNQREKQKPYDATLVTEEKGEDKDKGKAQ